MVLDLLMEHRLLSAGSIRSQKITAFHTSFRDMLLLVLFYIHLYDPSWARIYNKMGKPSSVGTRRDNPFCNLQ